jgi:hypothetical protein
MGCVSSKTTDALVAAPVQTPETKVDAGNPVQTPETKVDAGKTQKEAIDQEQLVATVADEPAAEPATNADAPIVKQESDQLAHVQGDENVDDFDDAVAEPPAKIDCVDDAMPIESDVVQIDDESRGIGIGGSCCGISGGAGIGCHGFHCGLGRCGIGGGLRAAQIDENDVMPIESDVVEIDDESRGIGIGGSCCGIGGGAGIGCHGFHCGLGRCGIGCGF